MTPRATTGSDVLDALREVDDPALGDDIVRLGLVEDVAIEDGIATVMLALNAPGAPDERAIGEAVREAVEALGFEADLRARVGDHLGFDDDILPGVKNVVAVASGKGGVGKTTVAANLAAGLDDFGARVGLLDADVHGPNTPRLLPTEEPPDIAPTGDILPPTSDGIRVMSTDYLLPEDATEPAALRGPMVNNVLLKFIDEVQWGYLDYLVVDLPPGTGDASLNLVQTLPLAGVLLVTTPQEMAVDDARRTMGLFTRHDCPVLGVIENMSTFRCPGCDEEHRVFGSGRAVARLDAPVLAELPAHPSLDSERSTRPAVIDADHPLRSRLTGMVETVADAIGRANRERVASRVAELEEPS